MKQRDALPIFSFTNYYGAQATTVLLNASNSVKYAVKTADIVKQHKRIETLLERESINDLAAAEGRLVHLRDSEVVLFKVARSNYWQARFRIYTGKWIRFSTRRRNIDDAKQIACDRYDEARYRERLGFTALVKRFDEMAKCCVAEMRRDIAAGTGKKIYTAYIAVIDSYLIPFFGQMYLTSITSRHIAEFEVWRNSQLRRTPKVSTLLTFATAFTRITQTAVEQGWISDKVPVPKLSVRGEKGQARPAFTNDEVARIQQHLKTWYLGVEGYTGEMRLMLRDLVDILTLTGMRQGTESMNLEWKHIEWYVEKDVRYLRIWVSGKTGARWLIAKHECAEVLRRLQATHEDTAHLELDDLLALRMLSMPVVISPLWPVEFSPTPGSFGLSALL